MFEFHRRIVKRVLSHLSTYCSFGTLESLNLPFQKKQAVQVI